NSRPPLCTPTLPPHDALPICAGRVRRSSHPTKLTKQKTRDIPGFFTPEKRLLLCRRAATADDLRNGDRRVKQVIVAAIIFSILRSEEHTSELQSRENLVCRLL